MSAGDNIPRTVLILLGSINKEGTRRPVCHIPSHITRYPRKRVHLCLALEEKPRKRQLRRDESVTLVLASGPEPVPAPLGLSGTRGLTRMETAPSHAEPPGCVSHLCPFWRVVAELHHRVFRDVGVRFKTGASGSRPTSIPDFRASAWKGEGLGFGNVAIC